MLQLNNPPYLTLTVQCWKISRNSIKGRNGGLYLDLSFHKQIQLPPSPISLEATNPYSLAHTG